MKNFLIRKNFVIGLIALFILASIVPSITGIEQETISKNEKIIKEFDNIQPFFTKNVGQFPEEVLYQMQTSEATVYLCQDEIVTVFSQPSNVENEIEVLSIVSSFVGSYDSVSVQAEGILPHHYNYYQGNDPDKWYMNVPNYASVVYKNIYSGIDLKYYSSENTLKYDFIVSPETDPSVIQIKYELDFTVNNILKL